MPKDDGLHKHTLNLRAGDMEKIKDFHPDLPASQVIRMLVSRYVDQVEGGETKVEVEINI